MNTLPAFSTFTTQPPKQINSNPKRNHLPNIKHSSSSEKTHLSFRRNNNQSIDPTIIWTSSISRQCRKGNLSEAADEFTRMRVTGIKPNYITFITLLSACAHSSTEIILRFGSSIHGYIYKLGFYGYNVMLDTSIVDMYSKCARVDLARQVFDEMSVKNSVSWNSMIDGYMRNGDIEDAIELFDVMPDRDKISWTALIGGFVKKGHYEEALEWFREMQVSGVEPDYVTIIAILAACANLGALGLGIWIHRFALLKNMTNEVRVSNSLIDMYSRCGCVDFAYQEFNKIETRTRVSWNSMIVGFAISGQAKEALEHFSLMQKEAFVPDGVSFTGALTACSHAGLVEEGLEIYGTMTRVSKIRPRIEHFGCLVDLLSRSGRLEDALNVIKIMPMKPNEVVLGSLLAACRTHGDLGLAERLMAFLVELDPDTDSNYVLLSNIYAVLGKWDGVGKVRKTMKALGIKKKPGFSSIEIDCSIHEFVAGDKSHVQTESIYSMLDHLFVELRVCGLQGPLVKKELGGYTISTVVEYFHLLPYASILADWFSRANQENIDAECSPLADDSATLSTKESSNKVYGTSRTDGNLGQTTQNITTGKVTQDKKGNSSRTDTQDKDYVNISKRMNSSPEVDLSIGKKLKPCEEGDLDLHKKMESTAEGDLIGNSTQEQEVERVMVSHDSRSSTKDGERNDNSNMDFSSQAAIQTGDHSSVPLPSISQNRNDIPTMSSKMHELVHTFVAMLHMKRDELSHQQRLLEDAIALCEKNLRTVSSGEGDLMLKVNSLIEACNVATNSATGHTHTETHQQIETRSLPKEKTRKNLSEANLVLTDPVKELDAICCDYIWTLLRYYLSQKNLLGWKSTVTVKAMDFEYSGSGQDYYPHRSKVSGARDILTKLREIELDRICYQNNWILPRYAVVPTNGGFSASVVVQGMDFECLCTGDVESHPREARESAAKHVWTKLHNMAIEAKRNEVNGTPSLN